MNRKYNLQHFDSVGIKSTTQTICILFDFKQLFATFNLSQPFAMYDKIITRWNYLELKNNQHQLTFLQTKIQDM